MRERIVTQRVSPDFAATVAFGYRWTQAARAAFARRGLWQMMDDYHYTACVLAKRLDRAVFVEVSRRTRDDITIRIVMKDEISMAKKRIGDWRGFADINVGKADKAAMADYMTKQEEVLFDLGRLVEAEYKVTLSYHSVKDVYMCSISCYDETSPNYKHTMVSRASTPLRSLVAGLYKHHHIAHGVWPLGDDSDFDF